ncbi:HesA/MoeB/ThiF family protein [Rosenbergiella nectarea]|uniref:HesA/MoeB/ThiF family protein n=1 Tax=Rosenbergiella nectarea TaxID=988801 RepID=UPI001BDA3038|nr:ThiF family adenylyltransferase [Rosenbergiella nectarea]MBT0731655.1 ThiF family adenylyltransferase [Rosenbergiella nectarea subsp. apis]
MKTISRHVQLLRMGDKGIFGVGSEQTLLDIELWESIVRVVSDIRKSPFENESDLLNRYNFTNASEAIEFVLNSNAIIHVDEFNESNRYSRNHLYYNYMRATPSVVQRKIESSSVTIIGCGGIGTNLAYYLSTSGVGSITLVDDDVVEVSNLTRQVLFSESDIGLDKAEVVKREILKRNSEVKVSVKRMEITSKDSLSELDRTDLYIVSADSPFQLMDWINQYCVDNHQAYVNIGYVNDISVIGPFYIPNKTSCYKCADITPGHDKKGEIDDLCREINKNFKAATFPGVNGVAASYAFNDVIKYLGGFGDILSANKRVGIHSSKCNFEFQNIIKNPRCKVCAVV